MEIKTKEFKISTNEMFFALLQQTSFSIMFILILYALTCYGWTNKEENFLRWTLFVIFLVLFCIFYCWLAAKKFTNTIYGQEKVFVLKDGYVYEHYKDGSESKLNIKNISKIIKFNKAYLLFVSKLSFLYIPERAFLSIEECQRFCKILTQHVRHQSLLDTMAKNKLKN